MTTLRDRVFEDLDCGLDNGYHELLHMPPSELARDLTYYADYADVDVTDLLPHTTEWLNLKGANYED